MEKCPETQVRHREISGSQGNYFIVTDYLKAVPAKDGNAVFSVAGLYGPHTKSDSYKTPPMNLPHNNSPLTGKHIVVTAGGTIEPIDPVRYISNHSTGKMGYAIAAELASRGACVTLVSGRTCLPVPDGVERVDVLSAGDMFGAFMKVFPESDGAVMCAAVADYTPAEVSPVKIKKADGEMVVRLKRTKDIAAEAGRIKGTRLLAGFALETNNAIRNAHEKLVRKNLDFIVLNSLSDPGAGFGTDTNKITIIDRSGKETPCPLESKTAAAFRIADRIEQFFGVGI